MENFEKLVLPFSHPPRDKRKHIPFVLQLQPKPGVYATVKVVDQENNSPLQDARVVFTKKGLSAVFLDGVTKESGTVTVFIEQSGNYDLTVMREFYEPQERRSQFIGLRGDEPPKYEFSLKKKPGQDPRDQKTGVLHLTVFTKDQSGTELPLSGAKVTAPQTYDAVTNVNGRATLNHGYAAGQDISVTVSAAGYKSATRIVTLTQK